MRAASFAEKLLWKSE